MIDAGNLDTVFALRGLFESARTRSKPLLLWVGAGASSWCRYPRWPDLAEQFHQQFSRLEPGYDAHSGLALLSAEQFPELFQLCKDANRQRFTELLVSYFPPRPASAVYERFVTAVRRLPQQFVITTNIDELLERALPTASTVSRNELQRAVDLQRLGQSFVCKLHGSVSEASATVFASRDYQSLLEEPTFLPLLERLLSASVVVFVGYSLQDHYVLSLLARNADINSLLGDGPHFAILPRDHASLPPSVRIIRYVPEPHKDHRSSITILEEVASLAGSKPDVRDEHAPAPADLRSAHLLFHILPPGTWDTSHTLGLSNPDGPDRQMIVGTGFSNEELPDNRSTAMHDIIVGLLCFDKVHAPVHAIARVHGLVGSPLFWELVQSDVLSFVSWEVQEGIIFPSVDAGAGGDLGSFSVFNPDRSPRTVAQIIREQLKPVPGHEHEVEQQFERLEASTTTIAGAQEGDIPRMVRSLLLRPSIRRLLAMSDGTPLGSLPRWAVFPVLRLAHVAKVGAACRVLGVGSAKLDFGTAELAGPAFACAVGSEWADATASYVLAGNFSADLGIAAIRDGNILRSVLQFRESQRGADLRREVLTRLLASEGAEVSVAINAALRTAVPPAAMQRARDSFVGLFASSSPQGSASPAIWNDRRYSENALVRWRQRSEGILRDWCQTHGVDQYSQCPCGSGERFRFCCREAIRSSAA